MKSEHHPLSIYTSDIDRKPYLRHLRRRACAPRPVITPAMTGSYNGLKQFYCRLTGEERHFSSFREMSVAFLGVAGKLRRVGNLEESRRARLTSRGLRLAETYMVGGLPRFPVDEPFIAETYGISLPVHRDPHAPYSTEEARTNAWAVVATLLDALKDDRALLDKEEEAEVIGWLETAFAAKAKNLWAFCFYLACAIDLFVTLKPVREAA